MPRMTPDGRGAKFCSCSKSVRGVDGPLCVRGREKPGAHGVHGAPAAGRMTAVLGFIKGAYSSLPEINGATLSGAIDVLVIQQEDGSLRSSPWYLRIGKYKVLRPRDRVIKITVNEQLMDFEMKLSSTGDAYFCEDTDERPELEDMTSPLLSPQSHDDVPDGLSLSPAELSPDDSRATSPELLDADAAPLHSSAAASSSWCGRAPRRGGQGGALRAALCDARA